MESHKFIGVVMMVVGLVVSILMVTSTTPTIASNINTSNTQLAGYDANAGAIGSISYFLLALFPIALLIGGVVVLFR